MNGRMATTLAVQSERLSFAWRRLLGASAMVVLASCASRPINEQYTQAR